jgi:hypothetical protein
MSRSGLCVLAIVAACASTRPLIAQGTPPQQKPTPAKPAQARPAQAKSDSAQPPKRRSLEIHGQAPAPEVVTVRPREAPRYTHRIITPLLADSGAVRRPGTAVVILPAPAVIAPATPNPTSPNFH